MNLFLHFLLDSLSSYPDWQMAKMIVLSVFILLIFLLPVALCFASAQVGQTLFQIFKGGYCV